MGLVLRWLVLVSALTFPLVYLLAENAPEPARGEPAPLGYVCYRCEKAPTIDGKLDDAVWKDAPWSTDFVDIEGDKKPRPRHRTRMKMLWDDQGLYIAAELQEPHVWGTLKEHDSVIFHDPDFEVFLDPDGDTHLYGELELNALNTTWDLLLIKPYRDGAPAVNGWEIIGLKTAVQVQGTINDPSDTDTGWTVEIAWPWKGLREITSATLPPRDGDQHRINFSRVEWDTEVVEGKYRKVPKRPEHNWVWSPQGAIDMHRPERWGYLQYSTQPRGPVAYKPDADQEVKDRLFAVHLAQKAHWKEKKQFAASIKELTVKGVGGPLPEMANSPQGYTLTATGASGKKWYLTQDGRLWGE